MTTEFLSEYDQPLFGSLNSTISDYFADCVEAALDEGVSTLPYLEKEKQQTMKALLRKTYFKNVDVFEIYGKRNLFTVASQTPKRQQEILQLFQQLAPGTLPPEPPVVPTLEEPSTDTSITPYPSPSDIPTPEQLTQLQHDVQTLRAQTAALHTQRTTLHSQLQSWDTAEQLATLAVKRVPSECVGVAQEVAHVSHLYAGLVACSDQGKTLLQDMETSKRDRPDEEEEDAVMLLKKPSKKVTLEERYQQVSTVVKNENALNKVRELLTTTTREES